MSKYPHLKGDIRFPEIRDMYIDQNKTFREIGKEFGISHEYVRRILLANGISYRNKLEQQEELEKRTIHFLHMQGLSRESISHVLNMTKQILIYKERKYGLNLMTRKQIENKDRDSRIIELYKEGKSQKEIGERFNLAQTNVSAILIKHGANKEKVCVHEVNRLRSEGYSGIEISKMLNTSANNVYRILKNTKEVSK